MTELTMTKSQRATFLAEPHVGVLTIEREGSAPLAAPVWYSYEPGSDVVFSFERAKSATRALRADGPRRRGSGTGIAWPY